MIPWAWLLLTAFICTCVGFLIAALCASAGLDSRIEEMRKQFEDYYSKKGNKNEDSSD